MESKKPQVNSASQKELDKVEKQFEKFNEEVNSLTLDRMNAAPAQDKEQQTKLSQNQIANSKDIYLKPKRTISSKEKFNEAFREDYEFAKQYVYFIAENHELIGEKIVMWTKCFPGMAAEEWEVPVNKPVWAPRYVAEQIKKCSYHKLSMQEGTINSADHMGTYTGNLIVDSTVQRLNAIPASQRKSIFMGASGF